MKISTFYRHLVVICLLFISPLKLFAQRNYATSQETGASGVCALCSVTGAANAADGNLQTYSSLNPTLAVGATVYQSLIFPAAGGVAANTPVTIKLGTGDNLLDATLLGGIFLQGYNGNTAIGTPVSVNSLLSAASNNNQTEVIFAPGQTFDRIRITLDGGLLSALASVYVYDAFYGTGPNICNTTVDELHGISSTLLGLGANVGGVVNPANAIDGDLNTASTLNAGVAVASSFAQQTVIYNSPSVVGDSVRLTLSIPQALVDAGVLTGISVETFNGNTSNNDSRNLNSSLLNVRILDQANNRQKMTVTFVPQAVFDRVQLRLGGGIANALSSLDFYEAQHILPSPVITVGGVAETSAQVCAGSAVTLTATAQPNTVYNWYTIAAGGTPVFTGAVFNATPSQTTTYYVEAMRNGCTDASARSAVKVTVNPVPAAAAVAVPTQTICSGRTATFNATTVNGITVNWYTAATGGTLAGTGNSFTTAALDATTSYYAEAVNANGCPATSRTQVTATVQTSPAIPVLSPAAIAIQAGQSTTISISNPEAGVTYNWYNQANGGTSLFTGTTFNTGALTQNTTYYVEGVGATCTTPSRAQITVSVNSGPDVAVTPPAQAVNSGQTATITATSTLAGAIFNWYNAPTGGTPIFTGQTFTSGAITKDTTFYAEAKDASTGSVSPVRAAGKVTVNTNNGGGGTAPSVAVTPPTQSVNAGQTATFTASSNTSGAIFNWYTTPTGGAPVFTGAVFTTPPVNGNVTYYAEAKDPITNNVSTTRAQGAVTVNGGSGSNGADVAVTPPSQNVNPGDKATFTASSTVAGSTFNWYTTASGGTPVSTGATFTTPAITANTIYYAEAKSPAGATSPTRATGTIIVNSSSGGNPDIAVTPPAQAVNAGQTATFTASSTTPGTIFNWYTTPTGSTPIFTGSAFVTPPVNGNVTYYAEAKDPNTGNVSTNRAPAVITLNPMPDITVVPPTQAVNPGETATFTATSTTPGTTFNWYTTPTGGTPVYTGGTFTTPPINSSTTYYAEAKDPVTGAVSRPRVSAQVDINTTPNIVVTPPTRSVNMGLTTTFTASSSQPGVVFNWYDVATGGAPIYTGTTFTTPAVSTNAVYYVSAQNTTSGLTSPRATASVFVNISADNIYVPNAFTPNSDGKNDILYVYGPDLKSLKLFVYDQWGELQFQSTAQASGWDGTFKGHAQPTGVYMYYMEATTNSGTTIKKKGTITLLR